MGAAAGRGELVWAPVGRLAFPDGRKFGLFRKCNCYRFAQFAQIDNHLRLTLRSPGRIKGVTPIRGFVL